MIPFLLWRHEVQILTGRVGSMMLLEKRGVFPLSWLLVLSANLGCGCTSFMFVHVRVSLSDGTSSFECTATALYCGIVTSSAESGSQ